MGIKLNKSSKDGIRKLDEFPKDGIRKYSNRMKKSDSTGFKKASDKISRKRKPSKKLKEDYPKEHDWFRKNKIRIMVISSVVILIWAVLFLPIKTVSYSYNEPYWVEETYWETEYYFKTLEYRLWDYDSADCKKEGWFKDVYVENRLSLKNMDAEDGGEFKVVFTFETSGGNLESVKTHYIGPSSVEWFKVKNYEIDWYESVRDCDFEVTPPKIKKSRQVQKTRDVKKYRTKIGYKTVNWIFGYDQFSGINVS